MDDITLLRRLHDDLPAPRPEALAAARDLLMAAADAEQARDEVAERRTLRRRRFVGAGVAAAAAAALVVTGSVTGWGPAGHPERASAATLLRNAAVTTSATPDPVVGEGQWLRVTVKSSGLALQQSADGSRITGGYEERSVTEGFIPANPDGRWVQRSTSLQPGAVYGGAKERRIAAQSWADAKAAGLVNVEKAHRWFAIPELGGGFTSADTRGLPRDPAALRNYLEKHRGRAETKRDAVFDALATILASGTADAELRSSMYTVLAGLPGITTVARQATLDGRTGVAFALGDSNGSDTTELIIDPQTGRYLGRRDVSGTRMGPIPAGTVEYWTSVTTKVVDDAPRPTS